MFAVRAGDGLRSVVSPSVVEGAHTAIAEVGAGGTLTLSIDGQQVATTGKGAMAKMPVEGLEVGSDEGAPVGDYKAPHKFTGKIESIVIEIKE